MDKLTLAKLKSKYGNIYCIDIEGCYIYYRTLNAWEIQSFLDLKGDTSKEKIEVEKALCTFAMLDPQSLPKFKAPGSLSTLAAEIWSKSTPTEEEVSINIDKARMWADQNTKNNYAIMIAVSLCRLLPSIDLISVLELPINKLLRIASLVEVAANVQFLKGEGGAKDGAGKVDMKENMTPDETADALAAAIQKQREPK